MTKRGIFRRLLSLLLVIWALGFIWFAMTLPRPAEVTTRTDGIVALTGGGGRIPRALQLLEARTAKRLLVSGVDREVRPREFASEYKVPSGQMACCITLGYDAVDTRSNALETARWIKDQKLKSIRVVTTDWHMRRAIFDISEEAPQGTTVIEDAVVSRPSFRILFLEYNKLVARLLAWAIGW